MSNNNAKATTKGRVQKSPMWIALQQMCNPAMEQKIKSHGYFARNHTVPISPAMLTSCCRPSAMAADAGSVAWVGFVETQFTVAIMWDYHPRCLICLCLLGKYTSQPATERVLQNARCFRGRLPLLNVELLQQLRAPQPGGKEFLAQDTCKAHLCWKAGRQKSSPGCKDTAAF